MSDQHHRSAAPGTVNEPLPQSAAHYRVKALLGLIEDQQVRGAHQAGCQQQPAPLPGGQRIRYDVGPALKAKEYELSVDGLFRVLQ